MAIFIAFAKTNYINKKMVVKMPKLKFFDYNGKKISYIDYGVNDGIPVLLMHSAPGSHKWLLEKDFIAKKLGLRLIAIDRPGYGDSEYIKLNSFKELNPIVVKLLIELNISKVNLLGCSTGCAYSLAFAEEYSIKVKNVTLVSSVIPLNNKSLSSEMSKINKFPFYLVHKSPHLASKLLEATHKLIKNKPFIYKKLLSNIQLLMSPIDKGKIRTKFAEESNFLHAAYGLQLGPNQLINELKLISTNWNIDFSKINAPITFFHGLEDRLMPISNCKQMSESLNCIEFNIINDAGHFLLDDKNIWESVLRTFVKK
ncbi:MAG: peptidase [Bacillales bacterium]|jgi:pimeloyl-ACP methyl ester carboxylesterase|nr:peptidase [Bacillales bacterium]